MAEQRIWTSDGIGLKRLGVHGRPVVNAHAQLATVLSARLGRDHARLFARPQLQPGGTAIDWFTPDGAAPVASLAPDAQEKVRARLQVLMADIRQLSQKLKTEGDTATLVGHMLDRALETSGAQDLWASDGQPILVNWGHLPEGAPDPADPTIANRERIAMPAPPVPAAALPTTAAVPGATASSLGAVAERRAWWAWLFPLLLLLLALYLLLRSCEPLPPAIVEKPGPTLAADDPTLPEQKRREALLAELAAAQQNRLEQINACVPIPAAPLPPAEPKFTPLPPVPAKEPEPAPPPKPPVQREAKKPDPPKPPPQKEPPPKEQQAMAPPAPPPTASQPACRPAALPGDEPEVMLLFDGSGSMRERFGNTSRLQAAKSSAAAVINGLPPDVDVGLVEFTSCTAVRRERFYSASERGQLIGAVNGLQALSGTPLARGIQRAGNAVSGQAPAVIVVISDGDDSCGGDACAAARAVKASKPNVTINAIDLSGENNKTLQCVVNATGGKVLVPNSPLDLQRKLQQASGQPDRKDCP